MWPKVTVVIVNWNGERFLDCCLSALLAQTVAPHEIILVDNASSDASLDIVRRFPSVRLLAQNENLGFARGNNLAIEAADAGSEWIALLNWDAFVEPRWLEALLLAVRDDPAFDIFGSKLVDAADPAVLDGSGDIYHVSGLDWRMGHGAYVSSISEQPREVFSPCAVGALYRRSALLEVGGFDDDDFCHVEGVDLGFRLRLAELRESISWRLTVPVRIVGCQLLRIKVILRALPYARAMCGGYRGLFKHVWSTYKKVGISGIKRRIAFSASPSAPPPVIGYVETTHSDYTEWVRSYDTITDTDRKKIKARISRLPNTPLISIVMSVHNRPLGMIKEVIQSVKDQLYPNWELCIADDASTDKALRELLQECAEKDPRIKVMFRDQNGHISAASNSALELVSGEYIALLANDDLLREHALFCVAQTIVDHPDASLIYSDEDKIDQSGRRYDPYFKSDWNPDLFLSHNMISHTGVYRADLVRKLGGFREGYEGAQEYDLALRCTEQLKPQQIVHIPRVLYHWRSHTGSTGQAGSEKGYALLAGERALNDHFIRVGVSAKAELLDFGMYRVRYDIPQPAPLISLIIPTRNGLKLIKQCIESITTKTSYKNYEILIVDNNSDDAQTLDYFATLVGDSRIRVLRDERPFNYSALNNSAVLHAQGEYVGLINNDIEVITPQWLDEMMSLAAQPGVGAVGARLWYQNDTLQHGGVISGLGGVAGHSHKHLPKGIPGYFFRAQLIQTLSAVSAACLVIKKNIYQEVGGLDETNLKVAFNDVDFCLRVREAGYRNIWTPYADLYHHESATRGYEDTPEKQLRFRNEVLYMRKRWGDTLLNDPAYSPNLTLEREDFSFAWPPRVVPF
jgi:GT2 family glycosyltransferase